MATQAPAMSLMRPFPLASHPHPPFRIDEVTARIVDALVEAAVLVGERRILVEQVVDAQAKIVLDTILFAEAEADEIGRGSCRARVCQYVSISVIAVSLKKKKTT